MILNYLVFQLVRNHALRLVGMYINLDSAFGVQTNYIHSSTLLVTDKRMAHKQTPRDFLKLIIGRPVVVKLNSGADYRGVLISLDGYMNVVLEQTEEYVDGQLKNKYGDTFIRGNNVFYISTQKRW
ncbi:U6 snRNA-associated Sm-like protein LSm6 [Schistosoma japonicum]|nr:U6 snRNA-associated Sm-like protein LSm6 [Schistosoma japonicum]KAH8875753.1 U6 snRNA-associated Sm-like protein LSm6 [Schistosoma japonicum]KAH8875759.1 U6 snRNA-associated Sm-like protein LSm6 [Schistosoma japonicum]